MFMPIILITVITELNQILNILFLHDKEENDLYLADKITCLHIYTKNGIFHGMT